MANTSNHIKFINSYIPEFKLRRKYNNTYIDNKTYEEAKASLAKFAAQVPEEYIQSKYLKQAYEDREVYQIGGKHFLLKETRADDTPYLFAID